MLGIGKLLDPNYYFGRAVAQEIELYYSLKREAPGVWLGQGAALLGLSGVADAVAFQALLDGRHPLTGVPLGIAANRKVLGFDLCFRAPKSVSVFFGLGDVGTAKTIRAAHDEAVAAAVSYLERHGCFARRGHNGVERVKGNGFVAVAFRHRTSRAGDPHLHTYVLVANLALGPDGRWSALDGRALYAQSKTAGYLYEAHLRHALVRDLGVEWAPVHNGIADIQGVPAAVLRLFSKRRAEIEAVLAERGQHSPRAAEVATLDTRRAKAHDAEAEVSVERWRDEAAAAGFGRDELASCLGRVEVEPLTPDDVTALAQELSAATGLTERRSSFDERD